MADGEAKPRGWPVVGAVVMLLALAFLNLDGYHTHLYTPWGSGDFFAEPPTINWTHGWPCCFMIRSGIYSVAAGKGVRVVSFFGESGVYSRWPTDNAPVSRFGVPPLLLDVAVGLVLVLGVAVALRAGGAAVSVAVRAAVAVHRHHAGGRHGGTGCLAADAPGTCCSLRRWPWYWPASG